MCSPVTVRCPYTVAEYSPVIKMVTTDSECEAEIARIQQHMSDKLGIVQQ